MPSTVATSILCAASAIAAAAVAAVVSIAITSRPTRRHANATLSPQSPPSARMPLRRHPAISNLPTVSVSAGGDASAEDEASPSLSLETPDISHNLLYLLYNIAEDQARKEGYIHRGITCDHCSKSPIRGLRFKCCNCIDFDLCENCEALGVHTRTHVFVKIRIPFPPLANPRNALLKVFYPGTLAPNDSLSAERARKLLCISHFDRLELDALYEQYMSLATSELGIPRPVFDMCLGPLGTEKNLISDRVFRFFDKNGDDHVCFDELVAGVSVLCKGSLDEKVAAAFRGYDIDGDGRIGRDALHAMFKAYFQLSMELVRDVVKAMEEEMMDTFDDDTNKPVSAAFTAPIPVSPHMPQDSEESSSTTSSSTSASMSLASPCSAEESDDDKSAACNREGTVSPGSQGVRSDPNDSEFSEDARARSPTRRRSSQARSPGCRDAVMVDHRRLSASWAHASGDPLAAIASDRAAAASLADSDAPLLTPADQMHASSSPNAASPTDLCATAAPCRQTLSSSRMQPVMEQMSQEAIAEMVDKTFSAMDVGNKGYVEFEEFRAFVENDATLISWFETLGSVF